ncbi:bark storage protein a [Phtheirospermum japonicum]|uniref:Bark storage protein a n=1 Tax=Phtheirospermum japonicum TaxID=374723 RepID=A0A830C5S7_9LAMI|nr:bark storage protein a [Phtheirospermum japonicum]
MSDFRKLLFLFTFIVLAIIPYYANGVIPENTQILLNKANKNGPYLGLVIPNLFEMNPLLQHPSYKATNLTIDVSGRRFRFGMIAGEKVILVMTGLAMLNAGITTQLLLSLFNVKGVIHYGIAGNANPALHVGDVTIPQYWSHIALWSWQRYGNGPENELPLEGSGDYTREIGYIKFADYATNVSQCRENDNLLNNIWYQPEEIFPVDGAPEDRQHVFWVPADDYYFKLSQKLEGMELEKCLNSTTCLDREPIVIRVAAGASASIYVDNAAYRTFLYDKFRVTAVEMESAAVALICNQQRVPFITFRGLSDLAGGGSSESNEADAFTPLAATNSVAVVVGFIKLLGSSQDSA